MSTTLPVVFSVFWYNRSVVFIPLRTWLCLGLYIGLVCVGLPTAQAGDIVGKVVFGGQMPPAQEWQVTRDAAYCGEKRSLQPLHVDHTGGVHNAVVSLKGDFPLTHHLPSTDQLLKNQHCTFIPHVGTAMVTQRLSILNEDPLLHNTNIGTGENVFMNVALVEGGEPIKKRFKRPGILSVECNAHKFMRAYIHVFDHSFFTLSDEAGQFTISAVPSGHYTLVVWHEYLGTVETPVTVPESGEISIIMEYSKE